MWYWLDGLIYSRLIEQSLLSAIYVVGFFLGILIGSIMIAKVRMRYGWIVIVFIAALCTKALISIFEWLGFYNWEMMTSSPHFLQFCIVSLAIISALIYLLLNKRNKGTKRYYRR